MTEDKILVVDNEVGMLTLLRNYLTREGYDVTTDPSAEVALPMVEEYDIAVVLTDLRIPGMGVWSEIHALRPETQVILMTAFGSIDTVIEAIKAGARGALCQIIAPDRDSHIARHGAHGGQEGDLTEGLYRAAHL